MRPVDKLFGPTGVQSVTFNNDEAVVLCRCGFDGSNSVFYTTHEIGEKIEAWIKAGKPGVIQEQLPELTIDQRELCISGLDTQGFNRMARIEEEDDYD